ncbi:HD domain-containing protein [Kribbella sp. NPDC051770]|uniref:HD domain-containing protein n=1 Tax=Kribbella sp. NPDC051770 TaxID=3155413 RepID=UPI003421F306
MIIFNDLLIPATTASTAALEVATAYQTPALLSHSRRVYIWAAALAEQESISYDDELLFVASMFHDLGLSPEFDSHTVSFEVAAGHVARVFAAGAGWSPERQDRVAEVIVRHMVFDTDVNDDPEGHLIARAASLDIVGLDADRLTAEFRAEVLAQHPRLGLKEEFLACFEEQAARKTASTAARAVNSGLAGRMSGNPLDGELR